MGISRWLLLWTTLFIAWILQVLPIPGWGIWLRPDWLLLVLIYWAMAASYRVSVGTAFFVGLFFDFFNGGLIGQEAIAFVVVIYFVAKFDRQLWMMPLFQQWFIIGFFLIIYKIVIYGVEGFLGREPETLLFWASVLIDLVLWPWIFLLLNEWQKRFHIGIV